MKIIEKFKQNIKQIHFIESTILFVYLLVLIIAYVLIYGNGSWAKGFEADFNLFKLFFAMFFILVLYFNNERISDIFIKFNLKIIILLMFIPISTIYIVRNKSTLAFLCFFGELFLTIKLVKILPNFIRNFKFTNLKKLYSKIDFKLLSKLICFIFWINTFFVLIMCIKYNGLINYQAFNLSKVYEIRAKFKLPKYILYLYNFETKFILIFLTGVYLYRKKYKLAFITTLFQIIFFMFKADKIVLLGSFLVLIIFFILKYWKFNTINSNLNMILVYIFTFFVIMTLIGFDVPLGLIVRRMLLVPANLKFCYYEFFINNPKIGIVGTVINAITKCYNPYSEIQYEKLISDIFFNKPEMFSNTGFLIEGFVRWGYIGFFIIPIIFAVVLHILNFGVKNNSFIFMVTISIVPILNLNDCYLISSLTFGALLFLCIISLFFRIDKLDNKKSEIIRDKKEIFFISAANSSHTLKWVNSLSKNYKIHLIYCKGQDNKAEIINENVVLHELKFKAPLGYYLNVFELRKLYNKIKPDLINVHYATGYGTLARISRIKPILLSLWGSDVYEFPKISFINKIILERNVIYANEIASTSNVMAQELKNEFPNIDKEIFITPFGVDTELFNKEKNRNNEFTIGVIKTLEEVYAIDDLIKSVNILKQRLINNKEFEIANKLKCYIYGEGYKKIELELLIKELKLENTVFLKGKIPNYEVSKALNKFNVFCATSICESFGVAVVEAMACEIPVVVTATDGFKEIVDNNINGFVVNVKDVNEISNKIEILLKNKELAEKFAKNGREKVLKMYDWNKNVENMEKIYNKIISKKG